MTDAEFLKALDTPYNRKWVIADDGNGDFIRVGDIIDFVYREKAEIEDLNHSLDVLGRVKEQLKETLREQKAKDKSEIERLDALLVCKNKTIKNLEKSFEIVCGEARKEFAERLTTIICEKLEQSLDNPDGDNYYVTDVYTDIDKLLEEMEGE